MTRERYLIDLSDIPDKHKHIFESLNKTINQAFDAPGKIKRNEPGMYYVVIDDELIEIDNQSDEGGEWIAKEASPKARWYTDGHRTLKEVKRELGI